jgi:tRNA pseudouridine55 synthase
VEKVLNLYKERGETPLARIDRFRAAHPEYKNVPMSYVGRLDPMAEGVLLVLVGDENKNRNEYLNFNKEYTFEVLFGFATDTYDVLGLLTDAVTRASHRSLNPTLLMEYVAQMQGSFSQKYPPYSSKPLEGVPLFVKARAGTIDMFNLPEHQITVYNMSFTGTRRVSQEDLLTSLKADIARVRGDFRQKNIMTVWEEHLRILYGLSFDIVSLTVNCSSGTYVRSIANDLGEKIGIPALACKIVRTKVGTWGINKSERTV